MALTIQERKQLRFKLLTDVYKEYFANDPIGRGLQIPSLDLAKDREKELAYQYLIDKGYIKMSAAGQNRIISPTIIGIDFVENIES